MLERSTEIPDLAPGDFVGGHPVCPGEPGEVRAVAVERRRRRGEPRRAAAPGPGRSTPAPARHQRRGKAVLDATGVRGPQRRQALELEAHGHEERSAASRQPGHEGAVAAPRRAGSQQQLGVRRLATRAERHLRACTGVAVCRCACTRLNLYGRYALRLAALFHCSHALLFHGGDKRCHICAWRKTGTARSYICMHPCGTRRERGLDTRISPMPLMTHRIKDSTLNDFNFART